MSDDKLFEEYKAAVTGERDRLVADNEALAEAGESYYRDVTALWAALGHLRAAYGTLLGMAKECVLDSTAPSDSVIETAEKSAAEADRLLGGVVPLTTAGDES